MGLSAEPFKAAEIIWELSGRESAANGGIMRTSAVGLLKENVLEYAEKSLQAYTSRSQMC